MDKTKDALGTREKIGMIDTDPVNEKNRVEDLPEALQVLRDATIRNFRSSRVRAFVEEQIEYINLNRQVAESIKFFLDENQRLPANAPIQDIIAERKKIEATIQWFEAICEELSNQLAQIKEVEDLFLDFIYSQNQE